MRAETCQRPGPEAAGRRQEPGVARQAVTAAAEPIGPPPEAWREEGRRQENRLAALQWVQAHQGAPGVDGTTVDARPDDLRKAWPALREPRLQGPDVPAPGREVQRPNPGGGMRRLGIPTGLDRVITEAMVQVMSPLCEPGVADYSDGCRPGRRAHQAVKPAGHSVAEGSRWGVDSEVEQFFAQVHHALRRSRGARKSKDKRRRKRIRRSRTAGIWNEGLGRQRDAGTPQGSPRSPLWSTILLESCDQERERRGHRFGREADDATGDVRRQRAGARGMTARRPFLEGKRRVQGNRGKSAVDRPWKRQLRGDTGTNQRAPRLPLALPSIQRANARRRQITHQGRGRHIRPVIREMNPVTRGGVGYCRLATGPHAFEVLDQWRRRRLRKLLWEQGRNPQTRDRQRVARGVDAARARKATATGPGAWWNAGASPRPAAVTHRLVAAWGRWSRLDPLRVRQGST